MTCCVVLGALVVVIIVPLAADDDDLSVCSDMAILTRRRSKLRLAEVLADGALGSFDNEKAIINIKSLKLCAAGQRERSTCIP